MANLTASAVAGYPDSVSGASYPRGKGDKSVIERQLVLTLTGQGSTTNTISASVLGFTTLMAVSTLWDATNTKGYPAVIDPVNNIVILLDGSAAPAPVDVTSSAAYIRVQGTFLSPVPSAP